MQFKGTAFTAESAVVKHSGGNKASELKRFVAKAAGAPLPSSSRDAKSDKKGDAGKPGKPASKDKAKGKDKTPPAGKPAAGKPTTKPTTKPTDDFKKKAKQR